MSQQNQSQSNQQGQQIQIKAKDETLQGLYANMAQIAHTPEEFVLDFFSLFPNGGQLVSRVIVSPSHAKRLMGALREGIKKYEDQFGVISLAVVPDQKIGFKTE